MRTLLLTLLLPLGMAHANPIKVGVIDFEKLFTQTQTAKVDRAELDRLLSQKQTEVDTRKGALAKSRSELASVSAKLDPVVRARREAELDAEQAALKKMFEDAQALVSARERELSGKVVSDAKAMAPTLAQKHGISLVIGAAEALFWSAPSVIQVDLTSEIANALDQRVGIR